MNIKPLNILLADDDMDDCLFFKHAIAELSLPPQLTTVHDGEQLMQHLNDKTNNLPDILFLDLNMHRKNGFECLSEIKNNNTLKSLPVIVFSTSFEQEVVNLLHQNGAQHFIRKPAEFSQFKKIIHQTITTFIVTKNPVRQTRENFVLTVQNNLLV